MLKFLMKSLSRLVFYLSAALLILLIYPLTYEASHYGVVWPRDSGVDLWVRNEVKHWVTGSIAAILMLGWCILFLVIARPSRGRFWLAVLVLPMILIQAQRYWIVETYVPNWSDEAELWLAERKGHLPEYFMRDLPYEAQRLTSCMEAYRKNDWKNPEREPCTGYSRWE